MTSLTPSFAPSASQSTSTGWYPTPTAVKGLPDDLATLLTPEKLQALTPQETRDLQEYIESKDFQSLLDDAENGDEESHQDSKSNWGTKETAYTALGIVAASYAGKKGASMLKAYHDELIKTLKANRKALRDAKASNGEIEDPPELPFTARAFKNTGERIDVLHKIVKDGIRGVAGWRSSGGGSSVGRSSIGKQPSTEATSTVS